MAGNEPVSQQPADDLVSALVNEQGESVVGTVKEIPEPGTECCGITPDPPCHAKIQKIMATQSGVKLYSRPSMSPDAVIGTMPANMSFEIRGTARNPFGEFYKLRDGRYVSKGDAVKEI